MKYDTESWFAEGGRVLDVNRLLVADVNGQAEDNSDAVLIAAAPVMLRALRECLHKFDADPSSLTGAQSRALSAARVAIAEAEGT